MGGFLPRLFDGADRDPDTSRSKEERLLIHQPTKRFLTLLLCMLMLGSMLPAAWASSGADAQTGEDPTPEAARADSPDAEEEGPLAFGDEPQTDPDPDEDELPIIPYVYLWLGGTKVTTANAGDILGDGTVRFDPAAGSLTFSVGQPTVSGTHNGALIDAPGLTGLTIEAPAGLTLESSEASCGIRLEKGALTLNGEFRLTLSSADAGYGVFAAKGITANKSVSISAAGESAVGLYTDGKLSFGTGVLDVDAGRQAILAKEEIAIPDGYGVTLPEGGKLAQIDGAYTVTDAEGAVAAHAIIRELPMVTVTFDLNYEGSEAITVRVLKGGTIAEFPSVERVNGKSVWKLIGWYTKAASGTDVGKLGEKVTAESSFEADTTVYAHWRLPGDINGDGKVNDKDVTRLINYHTFKDIPVKVVEENLDVNGDGKLNDKDVTRLINYLTFGDSVVIH